MHSDMGCVTYRAIFRCVLNRRADQLSVTFLAMPVPDERLTVGNHVFGEFSTAHDLYRDAASLALLTLHAAVERQ